MIKHKVGRTESNLSQCSASVEPVIKNNGRIRGGGGIKGRERGGGGGDSAYDNNYFGCQNFSQWK